MKEETKTRVYQGLRRHHGSIEEIANRTGKHRAYVSNVLRGKYYSQSIWEVAVRLLGELKQKEKNLQKIATEVLEAQD